MNMSLKWSTRSGKSKNLLVRTWQGFQLSTKLVTIGVILSPVLYFLWVFLVEPQFWCGEDVRRIDDQCIGVTDGRVVLRADLADVLGKIWAENEWVNRQVVDSHQDVVGVVHLVPLPRSASDELEIVLRHELEGAYIAQWQENHRNGAKPMIRLLVANYGDGASEVGRVVPALLDKMTRPQPLVAAVVTGRTISGTLDVIDRLREGKLPVVSSRLTGDNLTNKKEQGNVLRGGLARVAPTNSDQAKAVAGYLKGLVNPEVIRAMLVQDTNGEDDYVKSLGEGFRRGFEDAPPGSGKSHSLVGSTEEYDSRLGVSTGLMTQILGSICPRAPDAVFFAGRSTELATLVEALAQSTCGKDKPMMIVAGADTVEFSAKVARSEDDSRLKRALNANISVIYTTQAHSKAWTNKQDEDVGKEFNEESRAHFGSCKYCYKTVFPAELLDDGAAIMGHDAITVAVTAIRGDSGGSGSNWPALVSQRFKNGGAPIPGASGWISLRDGNVVNKAVAIVQVTSNGMVNFLGLSSVQGKPCVPSESLAPDKNDNC